MAWMMIPTALFAQSSNTPIIFVQDAELKYPNRVIINVSYSSRGAAIDFSKLPQVSVSITNTKTGEVRGSSVSTMYAENESPNFFFENIASDVTYTYKGTLNYNGTNIQTASKSFILPSGSTASTVPAATGSTPSGTSGTGTSSTTSGTSSSGSSSTSTTTKTTTTSTKSVAATIGVTKVASNLESIIKTGGYGNKNGVALSITNSHARVVDDTTFDYTIRYHNANAKTLKTARIVVQLPDQYSFDKGDGNTVYSNDDNVVTIYLGTIEPKESGEVTFRAQSIGGENQRTETKATLYYTGGSVSATDTDSYVGGSRSVLGATAFGAGFFPSTFFGWLLIIIILIIITIVVRRYLKKVE
jgi:hypothetical protein